MDQQWLRETTYTLQELLAKFEGSATPNGHSANYWLSEIMAEAIKENTEAINYLRKVLEDGAAKADILDAIDIFLHIYIEEDASSRKEG